jgi:predicted transcriptional regulator of viral defense system
MSTLTDEQIRVLRIIRRPNIRSVDRNVGKHSIQFATQLARKGLVERLSSGRYMLTDAGWAEINRLEAAVALTHPQT